MATVSSSGLATRRARKAPAGPGGAPNGSPARTPPAHTAPAHTAPAHTAPAHTAPARIAPGGIAPGGIAPAHTPPAGGTRALAKPPVRKLAKDLGIDLSGLAGTGPNGSITREDVQTAASGRTAGTLASSAAAAQAGPAQAAAAQDTEGQVHLEQARFAPARFAQAADGAREQRIAIRGVRKHMATAVSGSAFTAPHVTEFLQADVTEAMAATARVKALPEFTGVRVSPLLFVARALLVAAARHPMINSSWDEPAQEIVVKNYVNLGIAATTGRGLVVPNIKDAHLLPLPDLARALTELAETARAGRTSVADMQGGTITITNVGVFGVDAGTPILSPGEAAILAFGQVKDAAWVHLGQLAVRKVTTLSLSFDHRIVDGDLGSAVLRDVAAMLEDPLRILAWS